MPLKRSQAPSVLFGKRKLEEDEEEEEVVVVKKKKGEKEVRVNHLDLYSKKKPLKSDEEAGEEGNEENQENGDYVPKGNTKKGKNVRLTKSCPPLYYLVSWKSAKKFDDKSGYGVAEVGYDYCTLRAESSKQIGSAELSRADDDDSNSQIVTIKRKEVYFQEGFNVVIGNKEIAIQALVTPEEYKSGAVFLKMGTFVKKSKLAAKKKEKKRILLAAARRPKEGQWKVPYKGTESQKRIAKPLHNPLAKDAVVVFNPVDLFSENKIAVVVDPILGRKLRPHQVVGIQFLYDCTMGMRKSFDGNGCILADDMGLGKSIQAIALLWTLLKQGPTGVPAVKRACVVSPSSLVGNWTNELKKWLGDRIKVVSIGASTKTGNAKLSQVQYGEADVLCISYDQLKKYAEELRKIPQIELLICDEGHKLKNAEIKTTKAVASLPAKKRVILSGTPIQNNLDEFYAMVNFVNPAVLGPIETFRNTYQVPIEASRVPDALPEEKELGRQRSIELSRLTGEFILRRTATVNQKYLPPKTEYTVFCKLTPMQQDLYNRVASCAKGVATTAGALPVITALKKLCNCPELIHPGISKKPNKATAENGKGGKGGKGAAGKAAAKGGKGKEATSTENGDDEFSDVGALPWAAIKDGFPEGYDPLRYEPENSGKLHFVDLLLADIKAKSNDKVVIISNYTQTLDVLARMCHKRGYVFFQLDGSTNPNKRTQLVEWYNDPNRPEFIFLLSSKAGGVGLNLIGGNHLILYDPDWNPANDAQAMARVWREGQKKNVFIYRPLSTGSIEEKIFQRQVTKKALSQSVVEGNTDNAPDFAPKDLKDLFSLRTDTLCDTHDMLGCRCSKSKKKLPQHLRGKVVIGELEQYEHCDDLTTIQDDRLQKAGKDDVTFVMINKTNKVVAVDEGIVNEIPVDIPLSEDDDANLRKNKSKKKGAKEEEEEVADDFDPDFDPTKKILEEEERVIGSDDGEEDESDDEDDSESEAEEDN